MEERRKYAANALHRVLVWWRKDGGATVIDSAGSRNHSNAIKGKAHLLYTEIRSANDVMSSPVLVSKLKGGVKGMRAERSLPSTALSARVFRLGERRKYAANALHRVLMW